ncbi:MAG: M12 family metallo-peptidase, partial [Rhizobacter sp.]
MAVAGLAALPAAHAAAATARAQATQDAAAAHPSRAFWLDIKSAQGTSARGAQVSVRASKFRAATLDRASMAGLLAAAPMEFTDAARRGALVVSLPDPSGGFQRFAVVESPVMEPGLAAKHPDIKTYSGRGIDDPTANLRMDMTPLGFHASVRSGKGNWYIDPHFHLDQSLYSSYFLRDVPRPTNRPVDAVITEGQLSVAKAQYHAGDTVRLSGMGFAPGALVAITVKGPGDVAPRQVLHATASPEGAVVMSLKADAYKTMGDFSVVASDGRTSAGTNYKVVSDSVPLDATSGPTLRTFRLALVTDPSYATYFGGSANVTPAKVTLVNRVTQMYEYDTAIRLVLIANNDLLNFDTAAQFTGTNGPCGGAACYSGNGCSAVLNANTNVIGMVVGAGSYDVGHIALGPAGSGGGVAGLGVVGLAQKGRGCTGLNPPVGDGFAIDYVAHEMGHQFAGPHTFNGAGNSNCSGNRTAGASVEPGSGSSIMAYAGICGTDNLQAHSDPYWSFQSFEAVTAHVTTADTNISEVQMGVLTGFTGAAGQTFQLRFNGGTSVTIGNGGVQPYTTAGIKAAIEAIPGWPAGATVTLGSATNNSFAVSFNGGSVANTDVPNLELVNAVGFTGFVRDTIKGGLTTRGGTPTATGNNAPVVTVAGSTYTIPLRTPFALTGSATDPNGDTITYMWEQTDNGGAAGTSLVSNTKLNGPLFRQFGTRAIVGPAEAAQYNSPGENLVDGNPTRVFPDMAQIIANNTNAETGLCSLAAATPTGAETDCFSEYLPTATYVGVAGVNNEPSLNFRLTARDSKGGVGNATTKLVLANNAGPFLVTAPNTAITADGGSIMTVSWDVANTTAAPVSAANVKI